MTWKAADSRKLVPLESLYLLSALTDRMGYKSLLLRTKDAQQANVTFGPGPLVFLSSG